MVKIAIVDDNKFYIDDIKTLLFDSIKTLEYEVAEYSDADDFLQDVESVRYDIVFLDIVFEKYNGIEVGKQLNERHPDLNIIFVSAYPEYFKDVYKVKHSYFLTKDFERERFSDAVQKAIQNIQRNFITVHTKKENHRIVLQNVLYFEGYLKRTKLFLRSGENLEININIRKIEALLPENCFVRTHQSFIVNMKHIEKYNRQTIFLEDGKEVPISRSYINSAREKIALFLGGVL